MRNDEFVLGQGAGHMLELAFRRNGWTLAEVHALSSGDLLGRLRKLMLEPAEPAALLKNTLKRGPLFQPWKTIDIGVHTADEVIQLLLDQGYPVDTMAQTVLRDSVFAAEPTQAHLANLSHLDLGFEDGEIPHFTIVRRRIKYMGFELCTPEIAAELRLINFDDQDAGITLMAMDAVEEHILEQYFNEMDGELELYSQNINEIDNYNEVNYICVIP